ncbi:ATP-dependent exoDNAse (exonuclease V) beta subunit (contains helicase and exonuclease domains) [Methylophilus rhizosphaerae]|uniref:DNA 3'-5' helicase n=1 Tax=Methylophilus rhizosphaerae TaxID=492660 RepID=A0A1G9BEQ6_9PROT|nr:UvrD-helicase domain-containing protein [Methylophilus rhizosphaerae]SDK37979.1 ATP-dependent exoDNAse (exonuclease V) beta subunit (contains helicase and exonuclease domains) [Methylophilus rhizosphaerae]
MKMTEVDFQQALALDAANRERALDVASFIVEAPAGAGKTELLTQRFLKLLQTVQAPEEIIAITFTNKAASEMRARILDSLLLAATGVPPEAPHKQITYALGQQALRRSAELQWHLLESPARLRIYTIDSLCANLARQMPLLSRFGTQPAVTEDAWAYYREAAGLTLQTMDDDSLGEPVCRVLRYMDNDQTRLESLLMSMLAKREQWLHLSQAKEHDQAKNALVYLIETELQAVLTAIPARLQQALMPIARYAASQLPPEHALSALLDWQTPLTASIEDLPGWRTLAELLLTSSGGLRKRLDKNMGLPATDEAKPYKEALTEMLAGLAQHSDSERNLARIRLLPDANGEDDAMIQALSQLLNIAAAQLWLCFQAQNEVDFVEIAQRAFQALQEGDEATELAMRLDYRIQHLLVDEFQDTSPMQIDLLKALTRGWQPGDGRTLFAVGDPMQSIYRFRKANVGLFLNAALHGIADIALTPLKLWRNNRSCPPVVDWINQTFAGMLPARDAPQQGAIAYRPFVATRAEATGAGVFVHPLITPVNSEDEEPADIRHLEAEQIIRIIQQTRADKPDASIAVLVRARKHLHALVTEMRRNHSELSFQAVEIEELANRQIVQDLLTLTHALHQRADRVHWLALLRAPWCGLTLADMHALIGQDGQRSVLSLLGDEKILARLSADGQARALHVRDVMQNALQWRGRTTVSRWVHNTWLRLGGADCLWNESDVQDVQAFFARIAALEQHGQFNPQALAEDVQKLYAAPDAKADASLQFMTIHKSKGLEFDTVILPGLDGSNPPDDAKLVIWEEVPMEDGHTELVAAPFVPTALKRQQATITTYDYLNDLDKTRAAYEDARVLYVAATRAERQLHLLGAAKIDKDGQPQPRKNTFLHLLWPAVNTRFTPEHDIVARATTTQTEADIRQFVPKLIRLRQPAPPEILQAATGTTILSGYAPDTADTTIAILEADIGTLAHLYLQLVVGQGLTAWQDAVKNQFSHYLVAMQRWLKQRGYQESDATDGAKKVARLLTTTLQSADGQWVLQPHPQAASELAIEQLVEGKKIIDRTFVADGVRWIVDYKSMPVTEHDSLSALAGTFKPQLAAYAQLFRQEGLPVNIAILFLSIGKIVTIE